MTQYVVWEALKFKKSDMKEINKFFSEKKWGKLRYVKSIKTIAGRGGSGGRSDIVFAYYPGKDEMKFYVQRFGLGIKLLGDYLNNNDDILNQKDVNYLKKLVKSSGDYEYRGSK